MQVALLEAAAASGEVKTEGEGEVSAELLEVVPKSLEGFDAGMNDDLNTPRYAWDGSATEQSLNGVGSHTRSLDASFAKALSPACLVGHSGSLSTVLTWVLTQKRNQHLKLWLIGCAFQLSKPLFARLPSISVFLTPSLTLF